jgi:N-acetylmuramoyl-L-alanine amidase CwlA
MEIKQMLVPDSKKPKYVINGKAVTIPMDPEWITIHETDNPSGGADDLAHARLQLNGNSRNASWHLQVDGDSCVQSLPFTECGLHAGDDLGPGNMKSIAIEICVNQGGNFQNAVKNAAEVTKFLMAKFNISILKVVQHNKWSGKNCPRYLRSGEKGIDWIDFIDMLKDKKPTVTAVLWDGLELKKGQKGRLTILKPINLYKRVGDKLEMVRIMQPGEVYRVYSYDNEHGGQYNVGGLYVTKMDGYIKYETPSKAMLERVNK